MGGSRAAYFYVESSQDRPGPPTRGINSLPQLGDEQWTAIHDSLIVALELEPLLYVVNCCGLPGSGQLKSALKS
jgi:hypothetical protein